MVISQHDADPPFAPLRRGIFLGIRVGRASLLSANHVSQSAACSTGLDAPRLALVRRRPQRLRISQPGLPCPARERGAHFLGERNEAGIFDSRVRELRQACHADRLDKLAAAPIGRFGACKQGVRTNQRRVVLCGARQSGGLDQRAYPRCRGASVPRPRRMPGRTHGWPAQSRLIAHQGGRRAHAPARLRVPALRWRYRWQRPHPTPWCSRRRRAGCGPVSPSMPRTFSSKHEHAQFVIGIYPDTDPRPVGERIAEVRVAARLVGLVMPLRIDARALDRIKAALQQHEAGANPPCGRAAAA